MEVEKDSFIQFGLRDYISTALMIEEQYQQQILEYLTYLTESLKMTQYEHLGSKTKLILFLSKYGSKQNLRNKVENCKKDLVQTQQRLQEKTSAIQQIIQTTHMECFKCNQTGTTTTIKYHRDDGILTPQYTSSQCPFCNGTGHVEVPPKYREFLTFFIQNTHSTVEFGEKFLLNTNEITTLFKI